MESSRFLFILKNSDSKSFSKGDDQERRLIHRHVQIGSIHRRQSSANPQPNRLPFILVNPGTKHGRNRRSSTNPSTQDIAVPTKPAKPGALPVLNENIVCRCSRYGSARISRSPCPIHAIPRTPTSGEHVIDPFASSVVNVDEQAHGLLQYFIHVSHPRTWHFESRSPPQNSIHFRAVS